MKTLNLEDAAKLLIIHPVTLQARINSGAIPAVKIGKRWVFIEEDLLQWIRSQYTINRQDVSKEAVCYSKEKIHGITSSPARDLLYTDLLKPATKKKPEPSKQRPIQTH